VYICVLGRGVPARGRARNQRVAAVGFSEESRFFHDRCELVVPTQASDRAFAVTGLLDWRRGMAGGSVGQTGESAIRRDAGLLRKMEYTPSVRAIPSLYNMRPFWKTMIRVEAIWRQRWFKSLTGFRIGFPENSSSAPLRRTKMSEGVVHSCTECRRLTGWRAALHETRKIKMRSRTWREGSGAVLNIRCLLR